MTTLVSACHRTCRLRMTTVRITIRCLCVSSDLPSPDDEGVDNHEVSLHAIRLDCLGIAKVRLM